MAESDFDLSAYLARIGWDGPVTPTLPVLSGLIQRHTATIPFENLDIVLGRPVEIDPASIQRKLVRGGRGGYCFEQNSLFKLALDSIGFDTRFLLGRVVLGMPAEAATARTHAVVRVSLPEGDFLADVGFGAQTPTAPLHFASLEEQNTPLESFRLEPLGDETLLRVKVGEDWRNAYRLSPETVFPVDLEMGNWFTSTRPGGLFTTHLIVARPVGDRRATLFNGRLTLRAKDGSIEQRELRGAAEYGPVLAGLFGLRLSDEELRAVAEGGDRRAAQGLTHPAYQQAR